MFSPHIYYNTVVGLYDPITLEKQPYLSPPVFKFCSIPIKLFWIWDYVFRHSSLYVFIYLC